MNRLEFGKMISTLSYEELISKRNLIQEKLKNGTWIDSGLRLSEISDNLRIIGREIYNKKVV